MEQYYGQWKEMLLTVSSLIPLSELILLACPIWWTLFRKKCALTVVGEVESEEKGVIVVQDL